MSTPTTNPVPSTSPNDLLFNAEKLDEVVNSGELAYTDRLGIPRQTVAGAIASLLAFTDRGAWAPTTAYAMKDLVQESGSWYVCVAPHTSSAAFATDEATKWRLYQGVTSGELGAPTGASIVGFTAGGAGAATRNVLAKLREVQVSVLDYGTTMADWQKAYDDLATLGGGRVVWPARAAPYFITGTGISITENIETYIPAGAVIDVSGMNVAAAAFHGAGTEGTQYALTANATKSSDTASISSADLIAAGITDNDWVRICSSAVFDSHRTNSKIGELIQVESVNTGTGVVTFYTKLCDTYNTADSAKLSKVDLIDGVAFTGRGLVRGDNDTSKAPKVFYVHLGYWPYSGDGLRFEKLSDRAIYMRDCVYAAGDLMFFEDFLTVGTGYGVSVTDACQDCTFTRLYSNKVRHLFTTNNSVTANSGIPRRITFNGFIASNSALTSLGVVSDAFDTHAAAEDINILNGVVFGASGLGGNIENPSGSLINVKVYGSGADGINIHNESDREGDWEVSNAHSFNATGRGVRITNGGAGTTAGYARLSAHNVSGTDSTGAGVDIGATGGAKILRASLSKLAAIRSGSANASIRLEGLDGFTANELSVKSPTSTAQTGVLVVDSVEGAIDGVSARMANGATGAVLYFQAASAGSTKRITYDGVVVEEGGYTSLRGVLRDNNAQQISGGSSNNLSAANTPEVFGSGAGHLSSERVVAAGAVAVAVSAVTTEEVMATITIPGGIMGLNSALRVTTLWTVTNGGNNKTLRVRMGGAAGTEYLAAVITTAASAQVQTIIRNRNSQASQVGYVAGTTTSYGTNSAAAVTSTVNTAADFDLVISGQKAVSGELLRLEGYSIEILDR